MPRFSRTRTSRSVISAVVIAITFGAVYQFHRVHHSTAVTALPLQMSVSNGGAITVAPTAPARQAVNPSKPAINPVVSQTPGNALQAKAIVPAFAVKNTPVVGASLPTTAPSVLVTDANAKVASGDLVSARTELNSALISGSLSSADADAIKHQMAEINQTLIFSPRQFPKDPLGGVYVVKAGDRMSTIGTSHDIPYELLLPLNRMTDARKLRYGQTLKVINGPFHVIVSKSKFTLDVYLGAAGGPQSTYITTFPVGLGTDNSTPTGTWTIKNKVVHPAYFPPEGHNGPVLAPEDPKNPLGAYWMGLEGTDGLAVGQRSYGIHGTIDPASIGKQSSMGCIRLRNEDVEWVYKLLVVSKSQVIVTN